MIGSPPPLLDLPLPEHDGAADWQILQTADALAELAERIGSQPE
jgi:hypothetical protein